jgi:hypothetical protein
MSLAVRLFVIDYAFLYIAAGKRQQNFPPRSVFFWVLMVSWIVTGNIVVRRSLCPLRLRVLYIIEGFFSKECLSVASDEVARE